jgi:hypothetical protein
MSPFSTAALDVLLSVVETPEAVISGAALPVENPTVWVYPAEGDQ